MAPKVLLDAAPYKGDWGRGGGAALDFSASHGEFPPIADLRREVFSVGLKTAPHFPRTGHLVVSRDKTREVSDCWKPLGGKKTDRKWMGAWCMLKKGLALRLSCLRGSCRLVCDRIPSWTGSDFKAACVRLLSCSAPTTVAAEKGVRGNVLNFFFWRASKLSSGGALNISKEEKCSTGRHQTVPLLVGSYVLGENEAASSL